MSNFPFWGKAKNSVCIIIKSLSSPHAFIIVKYALTFTVSHLSLSVCSTYADELGTTSINTRTNFHQSSSWSARQSSHLPESEGEFYNESILWVFEKIQTVSHSRMCSWLLCVKLETMPLIANAQETTFLHSIFNKVWRKKKKKTWLTFGVLVHFPFLASLIYAISSSSVS